MGRKKSLMTLEYKEVVSADIRKIKDSEIVIKLKAIFAALEHREEDVAEMFNVSRSTLSRWIKGYQQYGVDGLYSQKRGHNPSKLSLDEKAKIKEWILSCKTSTNEPVHWTLKKLISEIKFVFDKEITSTPLWLTLVSMGLSLKKPRPVHHLTSIEKQEDFKKNS